MLSTEQNERLTRVGPGTPTGALLRRYWHPVAVNTQLKEQPTLAVRLLGENLVLYRDREGRIGLVDQRCPHRGMNMVAGIPEQCGLRCPYHGWLFDHTGRCLEQPFEETANPDSVFKDKIGIKAYPVQELGGLIFAYLGPQPSPLLPRWDRLLSDHALRDVGFAKVPCNWLQIIENSCDPVHHEWLHGYFSNYVLSRLGRPDLRRRERIDGQVSDRPWRHRKIAIDRFEYGLRRRRLIEGETEDSEMWSVGFPLVFPNYIVLRGVSGLGASIFHVPIDDTNTLGVYYSTYQPNPGEEPSSRTPYYRVPNPMLDDNGRLPWEILDNNSGQDGFAFAMQGSIVDRTREHLGVSDQGIILYRKLLNEQLQATARSVAHHRRRPSGLRTGRGPPGREYQGFLCRSERAAGGWHRVFVNQPYWQGRCLTTRILSSSANRRPGLDERPLTHNDSWSTLTCFKPRRTQHQRQADSLGTFEEHHEHHHTDAVPGQSAERPT